MVGYTDKQEHTQYSESNNTIHYENGGEGEPGGGDLDSKSLLLLHYNTLSEGLFKVGLTFGWVTED